MPEVPPSGPTAPETPRSPLSSDAIDAKRAEISSLESTSGDEAAAARATELRRDLAQNVIDTAKAAKPTPSDVNDGLSSHEVVPSSTVGSIFMEREAKEAEHRRLTQAADDDPSLHNNPAHRQKVLQLNSDLDRLDAQLAPMDSATDADGVGSMAFETGDSSFIIPKVEGTGITPPTPDDTPLPPPDDTPAPPPDDTPRPPEDPPVNPPVPPSGPDVPTTADAPVAPEGSPAFPEFEEHKAALEDAIQRLARAKDRNDSFYSKLHRKRNAAGERNKNGLRDEAELDAASQNLKNVFSRYVTSLAGVVQEQTKPAHDTMRTLGATVLTDPSNPNSPFVSGIDPALIARYTAARDSLNDIERNNASIIVQEMAAARYRVDQAQLEIKKGKPGTKFGVKFREWWTQHPLMRAGIGAGLVGISIAIPPLAPGALVLRRGMGTVGTYVGVEGAGRAITNKRSEHKDKSAARAGQAEAKDALGQPGLEYINDVAKNLSQTNIESGEAIPEDQQKYIEQFVQENYQDIFSKPDSLRAVLRGTEVSPSAVVDKLLDRRLDQLKSDSKWTRRSKYLAATGALIVGTGAIQRLTQYIGDKPPSPGVPTDQDLTRAYFQGIVDHHGPTAGQDWSQLQHLNVANPSASQYLWESNPTSGQMGQALSVWKESVRSLPADKQLGAAKIVGMLQDEGLYLNPKTLASVIKGIGGA